MIDPDYHRLPLSTAFYRMSLAFGHCAVDNAFAWSLVTAAVPFFFLDLTVAVRVTRPPSFYFCVYLVDSISLLCGLRHGRHRIIRDKLLCATERHRVRPSSKYRVCSPAAESRVWRPAAAIVFRAVGHILIAAVLSQTSYCEQYRISCYFYLFSKRFTYYIES